MDYLPSPSINVLSSIDNYTHYKKIFSHNKKHDKTILLLKKIEYDIFYSCKRKYPLLVVETITPLTGKTDPKHSHIDRRLIEDPFREDTIIPAEYRHTLKDYLAYMEYGGSMGHNAPAGQHKTNLEVFNETFLLSNITPQEMVFNSGLWVLMENWCKNLGKNSNITNIRVMTGSIPEEKSHVFPEGVIMNVPSKMFKIVCYEVVNTPGITFMEILIANNSTYYVNPTVNVFSLDNFLIPTKSHNWFQNFTGINLAVLLEYYGYNSLNIKPFHKILSMDIKLSHSMKILMKKSNWFGYLIYSKTVDELEHKWEKCKLLEKEFENLEFHQQFYELTKIRLIRDKQPLNTQVITKLFGKTKTKSSSRIKKTKTHKSRTHT
jgi:DNA/RNA endonuclease G (NUC1)